MHLPDKKAVNKWHYDSDDDHRHPEGEINFQIALTDSLDTQAMWIESVPGLRDFFPVNLKENQFVLYRWELKKIIQILRKKAQVDPSLDIPRSANNQ